MHFTQSSKLFQRAQQCIPGGVNSPVRAFRSVGASPLFITDGKGSKITDADGNTFIDYIGSWGPLILGHCHETIQEAVQKALERGASFGAPTENEIIIAEMICDAVSSMEMVRLVSSGSEATMAALRVARGYTKKDKFIKFEGCYHGSVDPFLIKAGSGALTLGVPDSPGIPASVVEHTLLAEYNNLNSVIELIDMNPGEIAAIILEPVPGNMGMIAPEHGFLQGLRDLCDREGIVLIFDEVMTGFRVDYGGAQALLGVMPDMSTFGKVIGGGMPVGAYGGRKDIMECVAPAGSVYQAGTLSGNPVSVAAGIATLNLLKDGKAYADLGQSTSWLIQEFRDAAKSAGVPIQTTSMGGMMGFFFSEKPVRNFQDALKIDTKLFSKVFGKMLTQGVYLAPSAYESLFISTAHSEEDLEKTAQAFRNALQ